MKIAFGDFAASWFKDRGYAATTRERNAGVLNRHILPTFRAVPLREITTPQVRRWRTDLLDAGVGPATLSKAYQVLRAILNTAVDDELIERNPCRVKGAGTVTHTERPFLSVPEVYRLADAVPPRCRALVLLAAFAALRFGELAALQRRDVDLEARTVSVRRSYAETRTHGLTVKAPKSAAGVRTVAFPASLVPEPAHHLAEHAEAAEPGSSSSGPAVVSCGGTTSGGSGSARSPRPVSVTSTSTISGTPGTPSRRPAAPRPVS